MYQVVIIEDDPAIAQLNRAFLERDSRFQLLREFRDARSALAWLTVHPADLLLLDVFMPGFNGLNLLRELRFREVTADVIMITAANDSKTVDALLKLGITDYLVKPFSFDRFRQALDTFCQHREAIGSHGNVSQQDLDAILVPYASSTTAPKGFQMKTQELILGRLRAAGTSGCTSEMLAAACGLSSVTVRRYMTYLLQRGEVSSQVNYDTGGRPSLLYFPPAD